MNASAIVMMLVALVVIWGGFVLAILRRPEEAGEQPAAPATHTQRPSENRTTRFSDGLCP